MSKNIILQHWVGKLSELEKSSIEDMKSYAEYCGAEHRLIEGYFLDGLCPQGQKLHMLNEVFDDYDIVVMLDPDMFTNKLKKTKNIFTEETGIGRYFGLQPKIHKKVVMKHPMLSNINNAFWGGAIYRLEREMRKKLRQHIVIGELSQFNNEFFDEGMMHRLAVKTDIKNESKYHIDRGQWDSSSYENNNNSEIIHIRPRRSLGGPWTPKIQIYRELKERGLI
tara:strand:- start:4979 stop:5647 length:669 start_codon:yes stop_codon:yes gene_type:complete